MRFAVLIALVVAPLMLLAAPAPKAGPQRVIAVASNKDGTWGVYLVLPSTGESKRITDPKTDAYGPAWSPDGKRIAFISERGDSEIWTMKADGTDARQLTTKSGVYEHLQWSPDGARIAFVQSRERDRIVVADAATGKHRVVVDAPSGFPSWSPDGARLLHIRHTPTCTAYSCKLDGTDARRLSGDSGGFEPVWSPDGTRVAFTGLVAAEKAQWHVFTVGPDGKGEKQLDTHAADNYGVFPRWSPDGNRIAFTGTVDGLNQVGVIDAIDGESKIVTTGPLAHSHPQWSPDGKSLAYLQSKDGKKYELMVSDATGRDAKVLLPNTGQCIAWKPK